MTWIQTYTGRAVDLASPEPSDIDIEDIAHALSLQCRYAGHTKVFYSVAEHSWRVAQCVTKAVNGCAGSWPTSFRTISDFNVESVKKRIILAALLHDAHEAYMGDITAPMKMCLGLQGWSPLGDIQIRLDRAIAERFGFRFDDFYHPSIRRADLELLATEKRDLMGPEPKPWLEMPPPLADRIEPHGAKDAEETFCSALRALAGKVAP